MFFSNTLNTSEAEPVFFLPQTAAYTTIATIPNNKAIPSEFKATVIPLNVNLPYNATTCLTNIVKPNTIAPETNPPW